MERNKLKKILKLHKKWLNGAADGKRADLRGADLQDAYLPCANLKGANLQGANLRGANLQGTELYRADLQGADLRGANLYGANNVPLLPWTSIVPECGSFVGWKKVGAYIIKLKILDDAKRSNATGRKCRCSAAEVLEIQNLDGTKAEISEIYNDNYCGTNYAVGKIVTPDSFDDNRWNECSHGIHFFITRQEAVDYV